jgi:uncharacterized phage-associated protein
MSKPRQFELKKTIQALNFFLNQEPSKTMSKMKLLKLLWLTDRYAMRNFGYSVTRDDYYAMQHGPVGTVAKDILDRETSSEYAERYIEVLSTVDIKSAAPTDFDEFSETDLSTLRVVNSVYGKMTPAQLRMYTHKFPEWLRFEKQIESVGGSYKMVLDDFFNNPPTRLAKNIFTEDRELLDANKDAVAEDSDLRSVFA